MTASTDVLHLAYGGIGGHRSVVENIAKVLSDHGLTSSAILLGPPSELGAGGDWRNLQTSEMVILRRRGDLKSLLGVFRLTRQIRPRAVIAHSHRHIIAAWLGILSMGRRPRVLLVEHHSLELRSVLNNIWSLIGVLLSSSVIVLSEDYRAAYPIAWLCRTLRRKVYVIPNGVDVPPTALPQLRTSPDDVLRMGTACRLVQSKRITHLIRATAILRDKGIQCTLSVAGTGPEEASIRSLIDALSLARTVALKGALTGESMTDWYRSIDCYVNASEGETMSMSLMEAGSFGLPIVTTRVGGIELFLINDKSAVIIDSADPESIAEAIMRVRDPARASKMGHAARQLLLAGASIQQMGEAYLQVLKEIGVRGCLMNPDGTSSSAED